MTMHYPYVPITQRGPLSWPAGKRLAILITINLETWDLVKDSDEPNYAGGPAALPNMLPARVPDYPNYAWREYGQRVGIWRMFEMFDALGVAPGCTVNALTCLERRAMVDAAMERGCEIIAHNYEQGELLTRFNDDPAREEEVIARTLEVYAQTIGKKARGWLSSSLRGTLQTPEILVKHGLDFYCDIMNDDQPYMMNTPSGDIVSIPYTIETNDYTLLSRRGHTTDEYRDILIEELQVLYEESATSARILNVGLHPHVSGRAYRIRALREFVQAAQKLDGVWWATRAEIADWYRQCHEEHIRPTR